MTRTRPTVPPVLLAVLLLVSAELLAAPEQQFDKEVRAIWVTRWDFRSAEDVRSIVRNCSALGLNRIYFQVRGRADAFYRSELEPWGEELGGRDPGYDPLALAIEESHRRGIELHAWVNVLAGWKGRKPPKNPNHIWHTHPEWFLQDRAGKRYRLDDHYTMLNPCLTAVRSHIRSVLVDLVSRYAVDGLHLDYIRFVFPDSRRRDSIPWDRTTLATFDKVVGGSPGSDKPRWDEFRTRAVNTVVFRVSEAVRRVKPRLNISAAVIRDLERGRRVFFQDSPTWLAQGWVDEILPMSYVRDHDGFSRSTVTDMERSQRSRLIPGLGAHLYKNAKELQRQVEISRSLGARGYCLFAYTSFYSTPSHASERGARAERLRREMRSALRRLNNST